MLKQFNPPISFLVWILLFLNATFLYSEEVLPVNHSSYEFIDENVQNEPVKAYLLSEYSEFKEDTPFWVAVELNLEKDWHLYWKNPGDTGVPVSIDWDLPEGFKNEGFLWPAPTKIDNDSFIGFGLQQNSYLLTKIVPPKNFKDDNATITANIKYLVCSDSACLPGDLSASLTLKTTEDTPTVNEDNALKFSMARKTLPQEAIVTALRRDELIELSFPLQSKNKIVSAFFAPEKDQAIDYHFEPVVTLKEGDNQVYKVALKEDKTLGQKNFLKGVLVVTTDDETKSAIDIHSPIESALESEVIAMGEPIKKLTTVAAQRDDSDLSFSLALLFAFIGGMILNLMPCVLPVLSFKILSFVKLAGQSRRLTFQHGLVFSLGVMLSFWTLAIAFLVLQAYGQTVGWGFQLQEPLFVAILAAILLVFSLSMFGLFEMGTKIGSMAGQMEYEGAKAGFTSSFLSGVLATLIATPCTGPFLGTVIGLAMTLPFYMSFLIFSSLGFGMAFPYLLLSAYPQLMRFLPKPGNWMIVFKQLMGFLMLASVLWLVWVFGAQTNAEALTILLGSFFIISLACWIYGEWGSFANSKKARALSTVTASFLMVLSVYVMTYATGSDPGSLGTTVIASGDEVWESFSPSRLKELQDQGIPVFVDFTAKWCLICQTNHVALSADAVDAKFKDLNVVRMKADWTKKDPLITEELKKFGRNSVPLYVLYEGNNKKTILPQVLTPGVVLDNLR